MPKDFKPDPVGTPATKRRVALSLNKEQLQGTKKLVLQKADGGAPLLLDVPLPASAPAPKVTLDSPVIQNTDTMQVSVENADRLVSVRLGDKDLQVEPIKGKDAVLLKNLQRDGVTSEQKTQPLTFIFKDGTKATVQLEVVAARISVKR